MPRLSLLVLSVIFVSLATTRAEPPDAESKLPPKLTEVEQRCEAALAKKVKLNYKATPLNELIADLSKQVDLPITLNKDGLEDVSVHPERPIDLVMGELSLRNALKLLALELDINFLTSASGLEITSAEKANEHLVVRAYPVDDLIQVIDKDSSSTYDFDALIELITTHCGPDYWEDVGGQGSISAFGGCLVIQQTYDRHDEISRLLAGLRRITADQSQVKPGTAGSIVKTHNDVSAALEKRHTRAGDLELKAYVQEIAEFIGVPIYLDPKGLEEANSAPETIVAPEHRDAKIGAALREVLAPHNLDIVLFDEYVVITSQERTAEIGQTTQLYPVYDLIQKHRDKSVPGSIDELDTLLDTVTTTTNNDGWSQEGGQSQISAFDNPAALVVTTTPLAHDEVAQLLTGLRSSGAVAFNDAAAKAEDRIQQRVYHLYLARRQLQAASLIKVDADTPKLSLPVGAAGAAGGGGGFFQFGGMALVPPPQTQGKVAQPVPVADEVAELIKELLRDDSWEAEGVLLKPFHDVLIVRQRPAMLQRIEKLLREIDAVP